MKPIIKKPRLGKFKYKIDDVVRISRLRHVFEKEYDENWTRELFIITDRWLNQEIPLYELKDYANDPIKGSFYEYELQKVRVSDDTIYDIEKVIRIRVRKKTKGSLCQMVRMA